MVGTISFRFRNRRVKAVLEDDGYWRCDEIPSLVHALNVLYSPRWEGVPAHGPDGHRHLESAAQWLRGTVQRETDPGTWMQQA